MSKLVVLKLGEGSFDQGFPVTLQIGEEGQQPAIELPGKLPAAPALPQYYRDWQMAYRRLGRRWRLEFLQTEVTNVSGVEDCRLAANDLRQQFNDWLNSAPFRSICDRLFEKLNPTDEIRFLIQISDPQLSRLPWHLWSILDRYPNAEIALSTTAYERIERVATAKPTVNILAILGNSIGIDVQHDRALLEALPQARIRLLVEPQRQELNDQLWEQSWDILFFAGHSVTESEVGYLMMNSSDRLTLDDLKHALKVAIRNGLKLAIFNSCDGLGLARQLADLHIPQIIVMREPVPDQVAQTFLKYFLTAFAAGRSLYTAVRQARERLEALEHRFPCATWLPIICQNPAEIPQTWQDWHASEAMIAITRPGEAIPIVSNSTRLAPMAQTPKETRRQRWIQLGRGLGAVLLSSAIATGATMGIRHLGFLQPWELQALDQVMRLRPEEPPDSRILVVAVTEAEIQAQGQEPGRGSVSDRKLLQVLDKLQQAQPIAIGIDIYRDRAAIDSTLRERLQQSNRLIAVCKASDPSSHDPGVAPPPEIPLEQLGFSDFWTDPDGILRRSVLGIDPNPASACAASYAFSTQLAFRYMLAKEISPQFTPEGYLQFGAVVFKPLENHTGGYHRIESWGHQILLNYRVDQSVQNGITQVTLTQLLNNQVHPDFIKDRLVLIGVTAPSFGDFWSTPYSTGQSFHQKIPGVLLQAQMVSQILSAALDRRPLLQAWLPWQDALWIWMWAAIGGAMVWWRCSSLYFVLGGVGVSVLLTGGCLVMLIQGIWVPLIPSLFAFAITGTLIWGRPDRRSQNSFIKTH